jgi:pyrroline-5-carboxylate reductase
MLNRLRLLSYGQTNFKCVTLYELTKGRQMSSACLHANGNIRMGFVGTGKIAQAIILGLIKKEKLKPEQIYVSDANQQYVTHLKEKHPVFQKYKINFAADNSDLIKKTNTVMFCVKPIDMIDMVKEVSPHVTDKHLILSIAAGIKLRKIEQVHFFFSLHFKLIPKLLINFFAFKNLPKNTRVIRIMTNMTALIQQSCSVFSRGKHATLGKGNFLHFH